MLKEKTNQKVANTCLCTVKFNMIKKEFEFDIDLRKLVRDMLSLLLTTLWTVDILHIHKHNYMKYVQC